MSQDGVIIIHLKIPEKPVVPSVVFVLATVCLCLSPVLAVTAMTGAGVAREGSYTKIRLRL